MFTLSGGSRSISLKFDKFDRPFLIIQYFSTLVQFINKINRKQNRDVKGPNISVQFYTRCNDAPLIVSFYKWKKLSSHMTKEIYDCMKVLNWRLLEMYTVLQCIWSKSILILNVHYHRKWECNLFKNIMMTVAGHNSFTMLSHKCNWSESECSYFSWLLNTPVRRNDIWALIAGGCFIAWSMLRTCSCDFFNNLQQFIMLTLSKMKCLFETCDRRISFWKYYTASTNKWKLLSFA